jgi:flagellar operon protein
VLDPTRLDRGLPAAGVSPGAAVPDPVRAARASFRDVLDAKLRASPLRFSSHALQRIERRGIRLDESMLARLDGGLARAAAKGARDSLVLVDQTAFVVSVPNRTVITAVDREHMREQVFTNIDSAVIA